LHDLQGKGIISGQFIERGQIAAINTIYQNTGKWLGLIGGDYWWYGSTSFTADTTYNPSAKDYWKNGGLIILSCSMANPTTGRGLNDVSQLNAGDILSQGTTTNTNFMTEINSIADGLADLQSAGVVVIFRPFHESNGNWFWWGTKLISSGQFQQMWHFVYDHFTNTRGLKNLLWLYSVNAGLSTFPLNNYPGSAYVDIIGLDVYTSDPEDAAGDFNTISGYGKVVGFAEFGPGSPSGGNTTFQEPILIYQAKDRMPQAVFFQQWWDQNAGNVGWGMASVQDAKEALMLPYVKNRGDF